MSTTSPNHESTREALIGAASQLFAKNGFDATTVRNICDLAGVNLSLVSYHFEGKEGLFRACVELYGKARLSAAQEVLIPPKSLEELSIRLEMFISGFFNTYLENPELTRMIQREIEIRPKLCEDIFKATFLKAYNTLVDFIKAAQKAGLLAKDIDAGIASAIVFGQATHAIRTDQFAQTFVGHSLKDPKYREKLVTHIVRIVIHGLKPA